MIATLALAAPIVLAGEQDMFHFPKSEEVRTQLVSRTDNETGWAFSVDSGMLACVWSFGQQIAFFFEKAAEEATDEPRGVILSTNPLELTFGNMANRDLFRPVASVEERIRLIAPFQALAIRLCDQPAGTHVGAGEL